MFEGLVVNLLNQYLGEFIENVSTDDLRAKVWSGEVSLKKLEVKTEALNFLQLPITVVSGYIGKIYLKADWTALSSKPVVVEIEDVYLIARPKTDFSSEEKVALETAIHAKLRRLTAWQQLKLASPSLGQKTGASWTETLATKIVNNLQISIRKVHLRYEDPTLTPKEDAVCCMGLCLGELTIRTTDENWREKFVSDVKASVLYKKLDMNNFGVYLNTLSRRLDDAKHLSGYFTDNSYYFHLVPPVSGYVRLKLHTDRSPQLKQPKVDVDCGLHAFGVSLAEPQYQSLLEMLDVISRGQAKVNKISGKIKFKDGDQKTKEAYVKLYKRTLNAAWLPDLSEDEKKEKIDIERKLSFETLARYRASAIAELRHQLKEGEDVMTREDMEKQRAKQKSYTGSISYYLGWGSKNDQTQQAPQITESELEKKREEIYKQMNYNPEDELLAEEQRKARPDDYIKLKLGFQMERLFLELFTDLEVPKEKSSNDESYQGKLLYMEAFGSSVETISYVGGLTCELKLQSFRIKDHYTKGTLYQSIVSQEDSKISKSDQPPLLRAKFEVPPLDKSADTKVDLKLLESTIIVNPILLARLQDFFAPPKETSDSMKLVSGWSARQAKYLSEATTASLSQSMEAHFSLQVSLDVSAPAIVVPYDLCAEDSLVLVIDFGQFKLDTELQDKSKVSEALKKIEEQGYTIPKEKLLTQSSHPGGTDENRSMVSVKEYDECYDCYNIIGAKFEVFLTNGGPRWRQSRAGDLELEKRARSNYLTKETKLNQNLAQDENASPSTLISPFDLNVKIFKTVAPAVTSLPRVRVEGELPRIGVSISPSKFKKVMLILQALSEGSKRGSNKRNRKKRSTKKMEANNTSTLVHDTSGLKGNILDAKENQTYADLKHALGVLPESDTEAKALMDKAKEMKGGVPVSVIRDWWEKRMRRLENITSLLFLFKIGNLQLVLSKDRSEYEPTKDLAILSLDNLNVGMQSRFFDSKVVLTLSAVSLKDLENPYGESCSKFVTTKSHGSAEEAHSFVRVQLENVMSDSPKYDTYPCQSMKMINVGDMHISLEPTRTCALLQFVLFDILGSDHTEKKRNAPTADTDPKESLGLKTFIPSVDLSKNFNAEDEKNLYYLKKKMGLRINLRSAPSSSPELKTGVLIEPGAVFKATERKNGENGQIFLKVEEGDNSGWAFMKHPFNGQDLIVPFSDTKEKRQEVTNSITRAEFGELCIHMLWKGKPVSSASINRVEAVVTQYQFSQSVALQLGQVKIQDRSPNGTLYPNAVETVETESDKKEKNSYLARITYDTYDPHEREFPGYGSEVSCSFRGLRVIYTARFLDEIKAFFTSHAFRSITKSPKPQPQVNQNPVETSIEENTTTLSRATTLGSQSVITTEHAGSTLQAGDTGYEDGYVDQAASFMKIQLKLSDVELWVPESSESAEKFSARIESITISNAVLSESKDFQGAQGYPNQASFYRIAQGRKFQRYTVGLSEFSISSKSGHNEAPSYLMQLGPVCVEADLISDKKYSLTGCWIDLGEIKLNLNQQQYQLSMRLLSANLKEKKSVCVDDNVPAGPIKEDMDVTLDTDIASVRTIDTKLSTGSCADKKLHNDGADIQSKLSNVKFVVLLDLKLSQVSAELAFCEKNMEEVPFMALAMTKLSLHMKTLSFREKSASDIQFGCSNVYLKDQTGSKVQGKQVAEAFKSILYVETLDPKDKTTERPFSISIKQGGGVGQENLQRDVPVITEAGTEVMLNVKNLGFILQRVLLDLGSFFSLPGDVVKDGWMKQQNRFRNDVNVFMALERRKSRHGDMSYLLNDYASPGGVKLGYFDLAEVTVSKEDELLLIIETERTFRYILPTKESRDDWWHTLKEASEKSRKSKAMETEMTAVRVAEDSDKSKSSPPLIVRACIINPCIILPRDPFEKMTDGLVLTWNLDADYRNYSSSSGGTQIKAALENVQITHASFDTSKPLRWGLQGIRSSGLKVNAEPLVAPFDVWFEQSQFPSPVTDLIADISPFIPSGREKKGDVAGATVGRIHLSPIVAQLRYKDYKLVTHVIKDVTDKLSGSQGDIEEDTEDAETNNLEPRTSDQKNIEQPGEQERAEELKINDIDLDTEGEGRDAPVIMQEQQWSVELASVSLTLINDVANFDDPIARLSLEEVKLSSRSILHGLRALVKLKLSADYFNKKKSSWEPMIEPWSVKVRTLSLKSPTIPLYNRLLPETDVKHEDLKYKIENRKFIHVSSDKNLELNLTAGMVMSVKQSIALLSDSWKREEENDFLGINENPCCFVNKTEFPLSFTINGREDTRTVVNAGSSFPFSFKSSPVTSDAFLLLVGDVPEDITARPITRSNGFFDFDKLVSAQAHQVQLTILANFPPKMTLKENSSRFLKIFYNNDRLVTSDVATERHQPLWSDIRFDLRKLGNADGEFLIQCADVDSDGASIVSLKRSELFDAAKHGSKYAFRDAQGHHTGGTLQVLQISDSSNTSEDKKYVSNMSWIYLRGFDMTCSPAFKRPDLAGNIGALIHVARQTSSVGFNTAGTFYSQGDAKSLHRFDSTGNGIDVGLYISFSSPIVKNYLYGKFKDTMTSVFSLSSFLKKDYVTARVHIPNSDLKYAEEWKLSKSGSMENHSEPYDDFVAQVEKLLTARIDFAAKEQENKDKCLCYTSEVRHGLKQIAVHSSIQILNTTKVKLEMMVKKNGIPLKHQSYPYNHPDDSRSESWAVIEPEQVVYFPSLLQRDETPVTRREMHIRPVDTKSGSSQHQWSNSLRLEQVATVPEAVNPRHLLRSSGDKLDFYSNAEIKYFSSGMQKIRILPRACAKNLLPDGINVQWSQKGIPAQIEKILPGEEVALYALQPSESVTLRLQMPSIGDSFSQVITLPPIEHFVKESSEDTLAGRKAVALSLWDEHKNELRVIMEMKTTALRVQLSFSAPYWIFDTTGLNLLVSENRENTCLKRNDNKFVSEKEKSLVSEGEDIEHARLFSFSKDGMNKLWVRSNPDSSNTKSATLPECPTCVSQGKIIEDIARNLKRNEAYFFQRGERLLYCYARGLDQKNPDSCVILTSKAVACIQSRRVIKTITLTQIIRANYVRSGIFTSDKVEFSLKSGHTATIDIWDGVGARFFTAMINYISKQSVQDKNVAIMRSEWSGPQPISAESIGIEGYISLRALHSSMKSRYKAQYEIGYKVTTGAGPWRTTTIINFVPRYFIMNNTSFWLEIQQDGTVSGDEVVAIKPEGSVPFHWPAQGNEKLLRFRCISPREGLGEEVIDGWSWSSNFQISKPGDYKMRIRNTLTADTKMARVEVRHGGASLFIVISFVEPNSDVVLPYRIENRCNRDAFYISQALSSLQGSTRSTSFKRGGWMNVQPHTHLPFAADDVMRSAVFEIALDEARSDSTTESKRNFVMNLSSKALQKQSILVQSKWRRNLQYEIHAFVRHDGPVKMIVVSEEEPDIVHINPFEMRPLLENDLERLKQRLLLLQDSIRENKACLSKLKSESKFAATGLQTTRKRPKEISSRESVLQLCILKVLRVDKSQLYCKLEFGDREEKVSLRGGHSPIITIDLEHARGETELRISLMLSNPLWSDECLGVVEARLSDFSDHEPVSRAFALKPCMKQAAVHGLPRWKTPPSSQSSKNIVRGALHMDVWWIPAKKEAITAKLDEVSECIEHRERVLRLLQPTWELSKRYNSSFLEQQKKMRAKRLTEREAREAALQLIDTGDVRFTIRLLDVRGRALERYRLLEKSSETRLSCVLTINATGQSTGSMICKDGQLAIRDWLDTVKFDLPRSFLAKAAAGDQRGRATLTIYLEMPKKNEVGYEVRRLGNASIPLADVTPHNYGDTKGSLALSNEFAQVYTYDENRSKGSWGESDNHWVTIQPETQDEVSLLVYCRREQGDLLPESPNSTVALALPRVGLSVVDKQPREILYLSISDTLVLLQDAKTQTTSELCLGRVQIDNQLPGYSFPFILCPKPMPLNETKEMLQISINRSKDNPGSSNFTMPMGSENDYKIVSYGNGANTERVQEVLNPQYYKENLNNNLVLSYVDFLLQEFELNIEENLYWELLSFYEEIQSSKGQKLIMVEEWTQPSFKTHAETYNIPPADSQVLTIGLLKLQSMALKVSFEMSPGVRKKGLILDLPFDPTAMLISFFGSTLGSIEDMKIQFDSIMMQNVHASTASLTNELLRHYKTDLIAQWYKIVFGLQIIGNPVGALENMADGVMSFFLEPAKGIVEDPGVLGFSRGVAKGSKALLESTISSTFDAVGKVTGSISKGVAVLSMDDEFIQRNRQTNKEKPKHIGEGLFSGAKSVGMGLVGGISGIITDPIKGAQKEGVGGFFKGTAKGLLGVVAKPTAGVINATSQTLKSVGTTATLVLADSVIGTQKVRPPRYIPVKAGCLPLYDYSLSLGSHLLSMKHINEALMGVMVTNKSVADAKLSTYASPRVIQMDLKSPTKNKKDIEKQLPHAVMITESRVLVQHLVEDGSWKPVADVKLDRIKGLLAGGLKGQSGIWAVQIEAQRGKPATVWCSGQDEAEKLKALITRLTTGP